MSGHALAAVADWHGSAACGGTNNKAFFRSSPAEAKAICHGCPVRPECLYDALDADAPSGVWGGLTTKERRALPPLPEGRRQAIAVLRGLLDDTAQPPAEGTPPVSLVTPAKPGSRYSPEERAAYERRTLELLREGASFRQITDEVGISAPTILRIRQEAGLPASELTGGHPARTKAEVLAEALEPYGHGHARWTGPMTGRMPQLCAEGDRFNARHVVFEEHHVRPPVGPVRSNCGETACMAGAHLTDTQLRNATPEEPVTVQALHNLRDEIDRQGGPQAARDNRLRLDDTPPAERTSHPMPSTPAAASEPTPAVPFEPTILSEGKLLAWGDAHLDPDVQDQAARARAILGGLRQRHAADQELAAISTEAEELQQRLAELQARQAQLAPAKPKGRRASPGYDTKVVRDWARVNNIPCPDRGRVPKAVVDAWREATGGES